MVVFTQGCISFPQNVEATLKFKASEERHNFRTEDQQILGATVQG